MSKIRVTIVIPVYYNDGTPVEDEKLVNTLDELTERFTGSSREDSSIEGRWIQTVGKDKIYYKDKNRTLWIICDNTVKNRRFFNKYKRKLEARFQQESILMFFSNVTIIE